MTYKRLLVEKTDGVARITLNRPEVRNAMDETTLAEITLAFRSFYKDKSVRAAVFSGARPDFCAGADIGWMRRAAEYSQTQARQDAKRLIDMCRAVDESPYPVIAKIHGNCFGGALGLIAASDIVIAEDSCRFRFSETRLGIIPAVVSTFCLPKIGMSHARHLYLTARVFDAAQAKQVGLVHTVVTPDKLEAETVKTLDLIRANGPEAVRAAKAYVKAIEFMPRAKRVVYSGPLLAKIRAGAEAKEGLSAFLEKRDPKWVRSA